MLPRYPHSAMICGQTGCGKTQFILDILEEHYCDHFHHIVILCPTVKWNATYKSRTWIWKDPEVYVIDPGEHLHQWLRLFYQLFAGSSTLYIIDDCSTSKALTKKRDMLSAFSGRHADQSVWVLTQKYNSVLKDLREQTKWLALFYCKDRDSFDECLRENDVIPTQPERAAFRKLLSESKHTKLLLKTDQPTAYQLV